MVTHFNNSDNDDIHLFGSDDVVNINNIILLDTDGNNEDHVVKDSC